jgi:hypothetical protein
VNVTVLACPGKTSWLALTNSISILCGPGGTPARSIVLMLLASAQKPRHVIHMYGGVTHGIWRFSAGVLEAMQAGRN